MKDAHLKLISLLEDQLNQLTLLSKIELGDDVINEVIRLRKQLDISDRKIKVFISSPYTLGDVAVNVRRQLDMSDWLIANGYIPFVPLFSHFQHMIHPRPYEDWMTLDVEWLNACDCILRLDGESTGADREVKYAKRIGIPVFYSTGSLLNSYSPKI